MKKPEFHFDVSVGLKRVLGRELITDDEVAIFEMVKNSFDAGASHVHIYFDGDKIIVADDGSGMNRDDLTSKWLFVAYSSKREQNLENDFRDKAAGRGRLAGSKGVGRFETSVNTSAPGRSRADLQRAGNAVDIDGSVKGVPFRFASIIG